MREETRQVVDKPSRTCLGEVKIQEANLENDTIIQDCKDKTLSRLTRERQGKTVVSSSEANTNVSICRTKRDDVRPRSGG